MAFGVPINSLLVAAVVLACPLMMRGMHGGDRGDDGGGGNDTDDIEP